MRVDLLKKCTISSAFLIICSIFWWNKGDLYNCCQCSPKFWQIYEPKNITANSSILNETRKQFSSVINFKNIKLPYQMDVPEMEQCPPGTKMLIMIMSRRDAFEARKAIRQSWAKDAYTGTVVRYLIADPADKKANKSIEEQNKLKIEHSENGDLIFIRGFEDSYAHIHMKWYAGLEWHLAFCARVNWIVKTDDDTVVHLPRLGHWIVHKFRSELAKNPTTFFGFVNNGMRAIRDNTSKWYVSNESHPDPVFPQYLRGATYLASRQAIVATMAQSANVIGFNMDDVVFTGLLAALANATISDQSTLFALSVEEQWRERCMNGIPKTISVYGVEPTKMRHIYELMRTEKCDEKQK